MSVCPAIFLFFCSLTFLQIDPIKPDNVDAILRLRQQLLQVQGMLDNLMERLRKSPSSNPSETCTIEKTPVQHHKTNETYEELYPHDIRCPDKKALTHFQLVKFPLGPNPECTLHYEYTCCTLV